jgi:PAS domain S-box-containing protein
MEKPTNAIKLRDVLSKIKEFDKYLQGKNPIISEHILDYVNNRGEVLHCQIDISDGKFIFEFAIGAAREFFGDFYEGVFRDADISKAEVDFLIILQKTVNSEIEIKQEICIGDDYDGFWIQCSALKIVKNQSKKIILKLENISAAKRNLLDLKDTRDALEVIQNTAVSGIFIMDDNFDIIKANATACKDFAYNFDEFERLNYSDLFIDSDKGICKEIRNYLEKGNKYFKYSKCLSKDGKIFEVEAYAYFIPLKNKKYYCSRILNISGKKEIEKKFSGLETLTRKVMDTSGFAALIFDEAGKLKSMNSAAEELFSCKYSNVVGEEYNSKVWRFCDEAANLLHEKISPFVEAIDNRIAMEHRLVYLLDDDDNLKQAHLSIALVGESDKGAVAILYENKEALILKSKLAENKRRYDALMKTIPDAVYVTNKDGIIVYASENFAYIYDRFDSDYFVGKSIESLVDTSDKYLVGRIFENLQNGKNIRNATLKALKQDGSVFYFEQNSDIIYDELGEPIEFIHVCRDISVRISSEQELFKKNTELHSFNNRLKFLNEKLIDSENKFQQLFSRMTAGFAYHKIIIDRNGKPIDYVFLEVNQAFENLTGLKASEIVNKKISAVLPQNEPLWLEIYGKVAISGESVQFESFSAPLNKYYDVSAFSPKKYFFATIFSDITERKHIQEALQLSEDKYRDLSENSTVGIWQMSADGRTIYLNPAMIEMLDLDKDARYDTINYKDYLTPESVEVLSNRSKLKTRGDKASYNIQLISAKQKKLSVLVSVTLTLDENGEPRNYLGSFTDISELQKYQKALMSSENRFRIIADYASYWEIFTDSDGEIIYSNPCSESILGVSLDEFNFYNFTDLFQYIHEDNISEFKKSYLEALDGRAIENLEFRIMHKHKGALYASLSARPVIGEGGVFEGSRITIRDIDNQKNAEIALQLSERKYKAYIDNAPYSIIIFNENGDLIDVNNTAILLTEYDENEFLSFNFRDLIISSAKHEFSDFISALDIVGSAAINCAFSRKYKDSIFVSIEAVKLSDKRYLAFVTDISEKIESQEKIRSKESNLRAILDNNQQGILLTDLNYLVVEMNRQSLYISKNIIRRELKIGMDFRDLLSDKYKGQLSSYFDRCFSGERFVFEKEFVTTSGVNVWFVISFEPVTSLGEIVGACLSVLDITNRKTIENQLIESKKNYELLVNNMNDLVSLVDSKGRFVFVNQRFKDILGYSETDLIGSSHEDIILPEDVTKIGFYRFNEKSSSQGIVENLRFKHSRGHYLTFECRSAQFTNFYGEINTVTIYTDISASIKAQEALKQSEAELRRVTDGVPIMISHIDSDLDALFANKAFCRFFLNTDDYNYRINLNKILDIKHIQKITDRLSSVYSGSTEYFEVAIPDVNGSKRTLNIILVPYADSESESFYFLASDITEQRMSEAAYNYQAEFNATILQTVGALVVALDQDGNIALFNGAAEKTTGYSLEYAITRKYVDLFVKDEDAVDFCKKIERIALTKEPENFNDYILTKGGEIRHIEWSNTLLASNGPSGKYYIICTGIDVSDIRKAEKTVRNISEGVSALVGEKFFDTLVVKINKMLGADYTFIGELLPDKQIRTLSLCDSDTIIENITYDIDGTPCQATIRDGFAAFENSVSSNFRVAMPNSSAEISAYVGVSLVNANQEPIGIIAAMFKKPISDHVSTADIINIFAVRTAAELERMKSEQALALREESFRAMTENSPDIIMRFDRECRFIYASSNISEITGLDSADIIDKQVCEIGFAPELVEIWESGITKALDSGLIVEQYFELKVEEFLAYFDWRLIPELNADGDTVTVLAIARDFTKQKNDEKELINAKEKAEQSDNLKSAFLANMSHEIRTPMNAIIGFSNLLKYPDLSEEERIEYIKIINERGADLLKLINDIIDLSKIESGSVAMSVSRFALNDFLYAAFEEYTKLAERKFQKNIKHNLIIPDVNSEIWINSDKLKIRQIINNLYENAMKFTNEGFINIGYTARDGALEFFVEDSGIGIAPAKQEIIFERFRQVDDSHSKNFGGAGLGLAIAVKLAAMLNGSVRVESRENVGSKFYFKMNIDFETVFDPGRKQYLEPDMPKIDLKGASILIAEDEKTNYLVMQRQMEMYNAKAIRAANGEEAVEIAMENDSIKLIFMDLRMPEMNGIEATKAIRKFNQELPIIALTAYAFAEDKQMCLDAGCDDFLSKPIQILELEKVLSKYFQNISE